MISDPSYTEENLAYVFRSLKGLYFKIFVENFFLTYNAFLCPHILRDMKTWQ